MHNLLFSFSSIGPSGSAVCIYGASIGMDNGIYEVYAQDTLDHNDFNGQNNPIAKENNFFKCDAQNPRSDEEARYRVESDANVAQLGESPILVLDKFT